MDTIGLGIDLALDAVTFTEEYENDPACDLGVIVLLDAGIGPMSDPGIDGDWAQPPNPFDDELPHIKCILSVRN
jgi:hypothetical protein